jgi:hypothetical protein
MGTLCKKAGAGTSHAIRVNHVTITLRKHPSAFGALVTPRAVLLASQPLRTLHHLEAAVDLRGPVDRHKDARHGWFRVIYVPIAKICGGGATIREVIWRRTGWQRGALATHLGATARLSDPRPSARRPRSRLRVASASASSCGGNW